jgi:hypothetical protein
VITADAIHGTLASMYVGSLLWGNQFSAGEDALASDQASRNNRSASTEGQEKKALLRDAASE